MLLWWGNYFCITFRSTSSIGARQAAVGDFCKRWTQFTHHSQEGIFRCRDQRILPLCWIREFQHQDVSTFLYEEKKKKWSALSVWIKAHCETSTFKIWHLIISCYICLIVFLISFAVIIFLPKKETKLILSCHWHFCWWIPEVINARWPQKLLHVYRGIVIWLCWGV